MFNPDDYDAGPDDVESLHLYADGGLCPVYVKDFFQDERYEILNKLGYGGHSTVWAAQDHNTKSVVSIKVIMAKHSENNIELRVLERLRDSPVYPGRQYLPTLLDHFYVGSNLFIVTELLGPSIRDFSSLGMSPKIPKQLVMAVDHLHRLDIVHGDIHGGNVLFRIPKYFERELEVVEETVVTRKDGLPLEEGVPKTLVLPQEFDEVNNDEIEKFDCIQLIDFSGSFFMSDPPKTTHTVHNMSSPELIFGQPLNKKIDIWTLTLTIYRIVTGEALFFAWDDRRNLIPQIYRVLGNADWLLAAWIGAVHEHKWDTLSQLHFEFFEECSSLEDMLHKSCNISRKSGLKNTRDAAVIRFLKRGLTVDPSKRPTTVELLKERWISKELL
ncbi:kinase-like domain-containing protein [Lophiotrema nucula]|uniref:Kinase-like domain-containing protein n=1 Tax=Lophiotrema nucula TaxID=690887 RepID=A0A6A5YFZ2_9PLEO|nr:kinase-like domain-containing protein [Lophiotrema nucula]